MKQKELIAIARRQIEGAWKREARLLPRQSPEYRQRFEEYSGAINALDMLERQGTITTAQPMLLGGL